MEMSFITSCILRSGLEPWWWMRYEPLYPSPDLHSDINRKLLSGRKSYFLQLCPEMSAILYESCISNMGIRFALDNGNEPQSITHDLKKWLARWSEFVFWIKTPVTVFSCYHFPPLSCISHSRTLVSLFLFLDEDQGPGSRQGLWSVRVHRFIWHLHPTIPITSATHSNK